jgi:hypothetical protein
MCNRLSSAKVYLHVCETHWQNLMMRARRKLFLGVLLGTFLCISPFAVITLLFTGEDILLDLTMPRYPGMMQLGYTQGYYGANSGAKALYFWTEAPVDQMQQFYEKFSLPFVRRGGNWVTVFNPYADEIPLAYNVDGSRFDTSEDRECHYTQRYVCIKVTLMDFEPERRAYMLAPSLDADLNRTAVPPDPNNPMYGGTVIMIEFYMHDF